MTDKPAIPITDIKRVAGFAVVQAVRDSADYKHMGTPNVEMFEAMCERELKRKYLAMVRSDVLFYLKEALDLHIIQHGEREACPADDLETWDDALDDATFDALKACGTFSSSFTGAASVDTRLHDNDELEALATSAAEDAWKVASFNPDIKQPRTLTPREMLDILGVTRSMVEAYVGQHVAPTIEEVKEYKMVNRQVTLTKLHYAKPLYAGSEDDYKFDLEQAFDTDDGLASASLERIGCDQSDRQNIADWLAEMSYDMDVACSLIEEERNALTPTQVAELGGDAIGTALMSGDDQLASDLIDAETAAEDSADEEAELAALMGGVVADVQVVSGAAPAPTKASRKAAKGAADADPNVIAAPLLSRLKDSLGEKDEVLATGCGMSRATFNNYVKGKGVFVASDGQFNFLRDMAIKRRDELNAIVAEMGER